MWKVVGQHSFHNINPNNFTARTGWESLVWSGPNWEGLITPTDFGTIHPSAFLAVIVWKVMGQHLFLNIIPNNFTVRTAQKVWCDRSMNWSEGSKGIMWCSSLLSYTGSFCTLSYLAVHTIFVQARWISQHQLHMDQCPLGVFLGIIGPNS